MIVLGADPGLASFGWAIVRLEEDTMRCLALGVIVTKKGKGQGVLVTDDLHRRGQELRRALVEVMGTYPISLVCAESISYPRNAAAAAMIGRAWGVLDAELDRQRLPVISASPQAIKKAATGRISASKDEVAEGLDKRLEGALRPMLGKFTKTLVEHPVDALGAVVASLHHDHLRLALNASARQPELALVGV